MRAVDSVDFALHQGDCFGLLGPNGAGKTTVIEVIEGILPPTTGEITYKGRPRGEDFYQEVGIQFQKTELPQFLTVRETLEMFRHLYERRTPLADLVSSCRLQEIMDRDNRKISGGQRQRLFLAMALANNPDLIFLDEPTTGLDPQSRHYLWEIIDRIKRAGKTIVLTTHYMEEAQLLCNRVAIMDQGRIIASGPPARLLQNHARETGLFLPRSLSAPERRALAGQWAERPNGTEIHTPDVDATLQILLASGEGLTGLSVRPPNLEDLFLQLTGRELRA